MPEEWYDVVKLFWSNETMINGKNKNGIVKKTLTQDQQSRVEGLMQRHQEEMQKLLKEIAEGA